MAASYFLTIEPSRSPSDAWSGYYDPPGHSVSESNVRLVEIFPYAAGIIILFVLTLSRWPKAGAILIMFFSIAWFASTLCEEIPVADQLSYRFPDLGPVRAFVLAVPMIILAIFVCLEFGIKAPVLMLAAILAAAAILHHTYSIGWYLQGGDPSLHTASVAGAATATVLFASLLIYRQIYLSPEKAEETLEQPSE